MRLSRRLFLGALLALNANQVASRPLPQGHPPNPKLASAYEAESSRPILTVKHTSSVPPEKHASHVSRFSSRVPRESSPSQLERGKDLFPRDEQ